MQLERRLRCGPEDAGMLGLSGALAGIAATALTLTLSLSLTLSLMLP